MYEQHFGLTGLPFCLNPSEWQFFESASSAEVIPQIQHALSTASGVAVVTGPEGVGKTVLLHQLQTLLSRQGQAIVIPGTSLSTVDDLYVGIRRSLRTLDGNQVAGGCNRWEIAEHLRNSSDFWGPVAFLVDDAHLLNSGIFTELQFLLEQRSGPQTLCRLLLAGSLSLEETLAKPELHGFAQRIRAFSFLTPLRLAEAVEYLRSRVKHAGGDLATCFASDAVELIVEAADGSPRCLNLLADEAMMLAYQQEDTQVSRATVVAALEHLKHLPHAWNTSVSPEADASLNDSVQTSMTLESSSDGVIEIGAPASAAVGSAPATVEEPLSVVEAEESPYADDDADDDFPTLEELQQDLPRQATAAEAAIDEHDEPNDSDVSGKTFEDGYRLAELEAVGTPTVEIDDDLDRRLLEAAENASLSAADEDSDDESEAVVTEPAEILPAYRRWIPAGTWVSQAILQDELIRNWIPAERSSRSLVPEATDEVQPDNVGVYEVCIPAAEEPVPVWPPASGEFGPRNSIPVSELETTRPQPQQPADDEPIHVETIPAAMIEPTDSVEVATAGFDNDENRWSDGQLLSTPEQQNDVAKAADIGNETEPSADEVWLKIAELEDHSDEVEAADESSPKSDSKQLFTLPIALDEVTGECAPLADSVREIQRDLDDFQGNERGASLHTPLPKTPNQDSSQSPITEMAIESASTAAHDSDNQLIPPQWISRTRQVVSMATPATQLRPAAGAESYNLADAPEDVSPALSVPEWSSPEQHDSPEGDDSQDVQDPGESLSFRNLFTRIRGSRA